MTTPIIPPSSFASRHIGPADADIRAMLGTLGYQTLDELTNATVPESIRLRKPLDLPQPRSEHEVLADLKAIAAKNKVNRSFIGMGYYGTITPAVIQRNILENPGWYTQYTPYQAEISQGRLEALLNFQTMVADLTALPMANASLLDEGTAAAEAMSMCHNIVGSEGRETFFVSEHSHPQTIAVLKTRAMGLGIKLIVGDEATLQGEQAGVLATLSGVLVQYPTTDGRIVDYTRLFEKVHEAGGLAVVACDLLALTLIKPPGEFGADIAIGSAQRFGVPMGFGGPHAAFMATKSQHVRKMPGRLIGVSKDSEGKPALRLTLQTREQHIRREKATSNICTAQVLLAIMASMYAVYHGPEGLKAIAQRVHSLAQKFARNLLNWGCRVESASYFDTIRFHLPERQAAGLSAHLLDRQTILSNFQKVGINVRHFLDGTIGVSFDESATEEDVWRILDCIFCVDDAPLLESTPFIQSPIVPLLRTSPFLTHPVFNSYHSETEMLRYIKRLESKDLSLCQSMIPLGSCTMKLNAAVEMYPITWPEFAGLHPFAPTEQALGYQEMCGQLEQWLATITGLAAVSLQPNAGSQGEFAGLLTIRAYLRARGQEGRKVCLIPVSAHGTNPASAVMAGFTVVAVACDAQGNVDLADLKAKTEQYKDSLGCLMLTYPSTHGVFEEGVREICRLVHEAGGQVYMDGANMNAQVGLTSPGEIGADVCHLNLHKTFCIPHGGGGPGVGPIAVAGHLAPFLPKHPLSGESLARNATDHGPRTTDTLAVSSAPYGSASILPISWVYIALMGEAGLRKATQVAILNANYMAKRLEGHYPVVFKGANGRCAHEFIIDCHHFEGSAGVKVEDIAKRLMDYGFHAPTMSWPEPGTLMIEPTESESKAELDRLCDALIAIREEIRAIEAGKADGKDNPLKNAPHTVGMVSADQWNHAYTRQQAAYPVAGLREYKFWPAVGRIDNPYGDRNLMCTCPPVG